MMGGRLYASHGAIDPGAIDARREFNWWFDPEAARIVLRAPWNKMSITPINISVKTRFTAEMKATIAKADTPVTRYLEKYSLPNYMWDEIAARRRLIPPSSPPRQSSMQTLTLIAVPVMERQFSGILKHTFRPTRAWPMFNSISTRRNFTSSLSI